MKSGRSGETWAGIREEKFFVSFFFSLLSRGYSFLFASMHGRQTAFVLRLLALFSLLREILFLEQRVCFHILEMCFYSGVFFFTSLGSTWVWVLRRFSSLIGY